MNVAPMSSPTADAVENSLRDELAQGDILLATTRPILHHLLAHSGQDLFNDEVMARMRGMLGHMARQMLVFVATYQAITDREGFANDWQNTLAMRLAQNTALIGFAHALALESLTAERLSARSGIDAVLSKLLQECAASQNAEQAKDAMRALSAQARFMQQQRRMELPLSEIPDACLAAMCDDCEKLLGAVIADMPDAMMALREKHGGDTSRIDKFTALIGGMGRDLHGSAHPDSHEDSHRDSHSDSHRDLHRALHVDHAGVAMFVTALQLANAQSRETAVHSLAETQHARLALSLRAAGLSVTQVEEQFFYLHPDMALPEGLDKLEADRASVLLADSHACIQPGGLNA